MFQILCETKYFASSLKRFCDIIIDDNPEFLDQIADEGCRKILIDAPYNENCTKYERFYSLYDFVKTLA